MPAVYKYFDSKLEQLILDSGSFRIGTLYDYRKTEEYGNEIGDKREGKVGANSPILSWSSDNPILKSEHAEQFVQGSKISFRAGDSISFGPGGKIAFGKTGVQLSNVTLRSELQVQDLFVLSFSLRPDAALMTKMGYDACFEIGDIDEFLAILAGPQNATFLGWGPVQYQTRELHYELAKRTNPALLKEPSFSYQAEARALWVPTQHPIQAVVVKAPDAAKLCKRIKL